MKRIPLYQCNDTEEIKLINSASNKMIGHLSLTALVINVGPG